ncbi:menaquinone biosynthetic enzyme MqnA/MqnD family protein [Effusibacillus lacus]|uniref:Chorismate dehydratase n=1 Tax=Effusibacillus lacus TaxID=1348429 RepID=A0A292YMV6_9BACL|nr:menaquinone biosynthesis protein [Effusibacillus lacus]TCS75286.1 futalosine synthase [Effusibacillus lacus]GAX89724.1 ABC transporter substrate-binding protein [Effusibacillus lacus]
MTGLVSVGRINYSNVLPVFHFLDQKADEEQFKFISAVPTELNRMLAEGRIVAGPVSAFSYAEHADHYFAMADLSVSSRGPVGSIFLFSKRPMDDLDGRKVSLPNTSATSVNLLKVLLEKYCGCKCNYSTHPPVLDRMMEEADAALLIGDDALYWSLRDHPYHVYDLGAEWHRRTGLPMTFAIWAVRRDFVNSRPEQAAKLHQLFLESKKQGLSHMDQVVQQAIRLHGNNQSFWEEYFGKLIHDFHGDLVKGAEEYFRACHEIGLLPRPVQVEMWGVNL